MFVPVKFRDDLNAVFNGVIRCDGKVVLVEGV